MRPWIIRPWIIRPWIVRSDLPTPPAIHSSSAYGSPDRRRWKGGLSGDDDRKLKRGCEGRGMTRSSPLEQPPFVLVNGPHRLDSMEKPAIMNQPADNPEIIYVTDHRIACDGGGGALGHPKVFLEMGQKTEVECPYCDRKFVLQPASQTVSEQ